MNNGNLAGTIEELCIQDYAVDAGNERMDKQEKIKCNRDQGDGYAVKMRSIEGAEKFRNSRTWFSGPLVLNS